MVTSDILQQFMEQNSGRDYPLDPTKSTVPFSIIIYADILVPYSMLSTDGKLNYTLYINDIFITASDISFKLYAKNNSNDSFIEVANAYTTYSQSSASNISVPISPVIHNSDTDGVYGYIYLGDINTIISLGNVWNDLGVEAGKLHLTCIHPYPNSFTGISVNGTVLTGDIVMEAGEGVRLDVTDNNTIVINISDDIESQAIKSREEVIEEITAKYGTPITSINGICPNENGAFNILTAKGSCSEISTLNNGLIFTNPCATTCCDKSYLAGVMANIGELNTRSSRITEYLSSVASNLNNLMNELSMLKLSASQQ